MEEDINHNHNNSILLKIKSSLVGNIYLMIHTLQKIQITNEVLIEAVEVECLNCSVKDIQKYDTPITKIQYLEDCIK